MVQNADESVILTTAVRKLTALRADLIIELLPLLEKIASERAPKISPENIARLIDRHRLLRRLADLRRAEPKASDRRLMRQVLHEARNTKPGVKASQSSLRRWQSAWNEVAPDGLARGLSGLLDSRGRPPKPS